MEANKRLVTLEDLNLYNNLIKHSVDTYVQINVETINEKINEFDTVLRKEINNGGTGLTKEIEDRKIADATLQEQITKNNNAIGKEIIDRDTQVKQSLNEAKTHTDTVIGDLNINISGITQKYSTVTQAIASTVGMHNGEIEQLLAQHETINLSIINEYNRAKSREDTMESTFSKMIDMLKTTADTNTTVTNSHILDKGNPHNVTVEQIGAVKQEVVSELTGRVVSLEEKNESNAESIVENSIDIANISDRVDELQLNTVKNTGSQLLNGSLQTTGDITVGGDLTVKGTTKSIHQETITVSDVLLVLNDAKEDISALLSGIAINTGSDSYGIVYDGTTKSVKLGSGVVDNNGEFKFSGGGNPILTRAEHSTFTNGHVVVWDEANKRVIDGGVVPTLDGLGAASQIDLETLNKTVDTQGTFIEELNNDYTTHKSDTISRLSTLESGKQSVIDERLKTVDKTIYGAVNEVHDELDNHLIDTNPHNVTYEQVGAEPKFEKNTAFNKDFATADNVPMENGNASVGSLDIVARADHIHPTDISRAPVKHTSVDETYGKASDIEYGHVKVDTFLNTGSTNPVASNVIQSEFANVRTEIQSKVDVLTKLVNEEQTRAVEKESELNTLYQGISNRVATEETTRQNADNTLSTRIAEEAESRLNKDNEIIDDLDTFKLDVSNKYQAVRDLYDTLHGLDTTMIYVVAFDTTDPDNPKPYFKPLVIDKGTVSG